MKQISKMANHFLTAIAATSALFSLITWLFNIKIPEKSIMQSWLYLGLILIICSFYAYLQCKRKNRISLRLGNKLKVHISKGDLFDNNHHGIIVIPVNEYFDTIVDDNIISSKTIHGQFIKLYFEHRINELDNAISKSLKDKKYELNESRKKGKKKKYPLGTCADIIQGKDTYVLVALTHFNDKNNTSISPIEFKEVFHSLYKHLEEIANMYPIYMPLIGAGQSRISKNPQRLLLSTLECLGFMSLSFPAGINIIINQSTLKEINLRLIEACYHKLFVINY